MSEEATELRLLDVPSELLASILRQAAPATPPLTIHNASVADDSGSRRPGLTEQHPAYPILLAKVTEVALRSVCTQFRAVLPLSPPGEYAGGFYVQSEAHASSRRFVPLGEGDLCMHQYDVMHGVDVRGGEWLRSPAVSLREPNLSLA